MRVPSLLAVALLTACTITGLDFIGIEPVRIQMGQSTFDIRVKGLYAEAIRINPEWFPHRDDVLPRAGLAIERVSGCTVVRLDGDVNLIKAALDCGDGPPPLPVKPVEFICDYHEDYGSSGKVRCTPAY